MKHAYHCQLESARYPFLCYVSISLHLTSHAKGQLFDWIRKAASDPNCAHQQHPPRASSLFPCPVRCLVRLLSLADASEKRIRRVSVSWHESARNRRPLTTKQVRRHLTLPFPRRRFAAISQTRDFPTLLSTPITLRATWYGCRTRFSWAARTTLRNGWS